MYNFKSGSLVERFNADKERLIQALNGNIASVNNEGEIEYNAGSQEECREAIISLFDSAVYQALSGVSVGRVMEKVLGANGVDIKNPQVFKDYAHFKDLDAIEQSKEVPYNYGDPDNPEDLDE